MARIILSPASIKPIDEFVQKNPIVEDISVGVKYAFRAKIISDRYLRGFEKADVNGPKDGYETSGITLFTGDSAKRKASLDEGRAGRPQALRKPIDAYTSEPVLQYEYKDAVENRDYINLIDIDYKDDEALDHKGKRGYYKLTLPFVPRELSYQPSSKFVGIATIGRNNPHYHFTGSEDSLQFDIDWFSSQDDRKDVINSCRWVEALTKADAYDEPPHRIVLEWGSKNHLFKGSVWIVTEAPYTLSDFVNSYRDMETGNIVKVGMLPQQAMQKITLKRVTIGNSTTKEIINRI